MKSNEILILQTDKTHATSSDSGCSSSHDMSELALTWGSPRSGCWFVSAMGKFWPPAMRTVIAFERKRYSIQFGVSVVTHSQSLSNFLKCGLNENSTHLIPQHG